MTTPNQENELLSTLASMGCRNVNPENPLRVAVSITYLFDLLEAVERYLYQFEEVMIGAGKMKKEGLDTAGLADRARELQSELNMYAKLARGHVGNVPVKKEQES